MASTSRSARYAKWLSIPLGLVISAVLIWQASYAAFSDTVESRDNLWGTGHVTIEEDAKGHALFNATNLAPGDSGTNYIRATYAGSLAGTVSLYGEKYSSSNDLAEHILLEITPGTGGEFGDGTGFRPTSGPIYSDTLAKFGTDHRDFGSGMRWPVQPGLSATLEVKYTVSVDAPNSVQDSSVRIDFVGEVKSGAH